MMSLRSGGLKEMPRGPFGLPRITDFGPFVGVDVAQTDIGFVEEEEMRPTPVDGEKVAGLPKRSNRVKIEAVYDSRGIRGQERKMLQEVMGLADTFFTRQAGFTTYYYEGDVAWSGKTEVDNQFREAGLGTELLLQKIESMRVRGVEKVWALGVTRGGKALLMKHGFEQSEEDSDLFFREIK